MSVSLLGATQHLLTKISDVGDLVAAHMMATVADQPELQVWAHIDDPGRPNASGTWHRWVSVTGEWIEDKDGPLDSLYSLFQW